MNLKERAKSYLQIIVRNTLANSLGVVPMAVTKEQVIECIENKEVGEYNIVQFEHSSTTNGIRKPYISCYIEHKETKMQYLNHIID